MGTDKAALVAAVRERLQRDLEAIVGSQKATQAGAVHGEARQEGSKDTRAIEAGYLARGLAARAEGLGDAVATLGAMRLRAFGDDDPIALTALVVLEDPDGARSRYLLLPAAGGLEIGEPADAVRTITAQA